MSDMLHTREPGAVRRWSLTLAMSFLMATQSRALLGGAAGIGEISALVFLFASFLEGRTRAAPGLPFLPRLLLIVMWLGFFIGACINLVTRWSSQFAGLDLLVVPFSITFAACAIQYLQCCARPRLVIASMLTWAIFIQAFPLFLLLIGVNTPTWLTDADAPGIPFISRYMGWSENPNQLGLLICAYPLIAIGALSRENSRARNRFLVAGMLISLVVAAAVRSSTVFADYLVCGSLWAILKLNRWDAPGRRGLRPLRLAITAGFGAAFAIAFLVLAQTSINKTGDSDANGRFERWQQAAQGVDESYGLGVGPGGQSGETAPFQGEEAHNLLLDLTLQGGVVSLVAYLLLAGNCLARALALRSLLALLVVIAVLTQQTAHYTARQPISWVLLFLPFALRSPGSAGSRRPAAEAPALSKAP
jgi:O-antigen ligase